MRRGGPSPALRLLLPLVALVVLGGCGKDDGGGDWRGAVLAEPLDKPDLHLSDTSGHPFDLRAATAGRVTLLFFGYTNCPDVCPLTMGTLHQALERLPSKEAEEVAVVFVGVDPARDTPVHLRAFLDRFDERFVGVTGPKARTDRAQQQLGLPPTTFGEPDGTGAYEVVHPAQVTAFSRDGRASIAYTAGASQDDFAADLPRLLDGEAPEA